MGSHMRGVKTGICCEGGMDNGRKGGSGISERLGDVDDVPASSDESGGNVNDSLLVCGGVTMYWTGGHQQ